MDVHVTLYNAETMIEPCLKAASLVYPNLQVHDFGSEDRGPDIVKKLKFPINFHGRLNGVDYVLLKEEISKKSEKVFWIDADEVWPSYSLKNVGKYIKDNNVVHGFWRNLKVVDKKIYLSDFLSRGAVAWNTKRFEIHREWPREKIKGRFKEVNRSKEEIILDPEDIFCYHGVLLNLSSLPMKKNRWKKQAERNDQSSGWKEIPILPFNYTDNHIFDKPKFEWYK